MGATRGCNARPVGGISQMEPNGWGRRSTAERGGAAAAVSPRRPERRSALKNERAGSRCQRQEPMRERRGCGGLVQELAIGFPSPASWRVKTRARPPTSSSSGACAQPAVTESSTGSLPVT